MGKNPSEKARQTVVRGGGRSGAQYGPPFCGACGSPTRIAGSKGVRYKKCETGHALIIKGGHHNRRRKDKTAKRGGTWAVR